MLYWKSIRVVFALVITVAAFMFAAVPAFAASISNVHGPALSPPKSLPPQQCLIVAAQATNVGSQTFDIVVQTSNTCGFTFNVTTRVNTNYTDCAPFPNQSTPVSAQLKDQQTAAFALGFQGGCVICTDGVPTAFPDFHIHITVFAFGTVSTPIGTFQASSNNFTISPDVRLSNNPHPFVPPCP